MTHDELRVAMIERFERVYGLTGRPDQFQALHKLIVELVDNALAMMPDRAGEFPVGSYDESGRLVTYERRFTVRVAIPNERQTLQLARVDVDLDGYLLNSIKVYSDTEAIGEATREILQQLIADSATMGVDAPESAPAPEV